MVGWYAKVGYFKGSDTELKQLSQITFLEDSVWVMPELAKNFGRLESNDLSDMYDKIHANFGPEWYFVYGLYVGDQVGYYDTSWAQNMIKEYIPSYNAAYPKTNEFLTSIPHQDRNSYSAILYIPTLKRVMRTEGGIYSVANDGSLSKNDVGLSVFPVGYDPRRYDLAAWVFSLKVPYESPETLKNIGNVNLISIAARESREPLFEIRNDIKPGSAAISVYTFLFRDMVEPDFVGGEIPPKNPYGPGGDSKPGELPPGTFDDKSDSIPDSALPSISAANTGFTRIYNPTLSQVQDLAQYLWTDETVVQTIWNKVKQYFEDPMQAIIGFNLVPVSVPNAGSEEFKLMYIPTGVSMNVAANQFVDVDCGSVQLERYYGSALDQSPYTKVSCFLPYIGTVQLNTDEVMGTTLQIKYRVDIVSGSCVAKILIDGSILYQYSGHCAINIPISSADFSSYVSSAISVAKLAIGAAVGGAMGVAAAGGTDPSQQTNQVVTTTRSETETIRNPATGRQIISGTRTTVETRESPADTSSTQASFDYLSPYNITNTVGQVMASKPHVEHSGSFSGNTGYLGIRRPFLIIERPNMCLPEQYQKLNGFPAMITMNLSECKGYTKIQQVQLTGMSATNPEQAEIMGLLKSGVFF